MSSPYLLEHQVAAVWNAASFSIQEYGLTMNVGIEISGNVTAKTLTSKLIHSLRQRLNYWSPADFSHFPWTTVTWGTAVRFSTFSMMHIPYRIWPRVQEWLNAHPPAGDAEMHVMPAVNGERPMQKHLDLLSRASRSTDPSIWVTVDGKSQKLIDIVSPGPWPKTEYTAIPCRRYEISPCIGEAAQAKAAKAGFPMVSAIDDRQFNRLRDLWEDAEHRDRSTARADFYRSVKVIHHKYPAGESKLVDHKRKIELERLRSSLNPWRRSWDIWKTKSNKKTS